MIVDVPAFQKEIVTVTEISMMSSVCVAERVKPMSTRIASVILRNTDVRMRTIQTMIRQLHLMMGRVSMEAVHSLQLVTTIQMLTISCWVRVTLHRVLDVQT